MARVQAESTSWGNIGCRQSSFYWLQVIASWTSQFQSRTWLKQIKSWETFLNWVYKSFSGDFKNLKLLGGKKKLEEKSWKGSKVKWTITPSLRRKSWKNYWKLTEKLFNDRNFFSSIHKFNALEDIFFHFHSTKVFQFMNKKLLENHLCSENLCQKSGKQKKKYLNDFLLVSLSREKQTKAFENIFFAQQSP